MEKDRNRSWIAVLAILAAAAIAAVLLTKLGLMSHLR